MSIVSQIEHDFLIAFKAKQAVEISTLRLLKSALANRQIEKMIAKDQALPDGEALAVIKSEVKKRQDSIEAYAGAGRQDLAEQERAEAVILERYLPAALAEEDIRAAIKSSIAEMNATAGDFGQVMSAVMKQLGAAADGQTVSRLVKEELK